MSAGFAAFPADHQAGQNATRPIAGFRTIPATRISGVADTQRIPLLNAKLLTVYGTWQKEGQVTHLIAQRLVDHTELLGGLAARSRDFR
jgi:hypothetical protein